MLRQLLEGRIMKTLALTNESSHFTLKFSYKTEEDF